MSIPNVSTTSTNGSTSTRSPTEEKALILLGQGIPPVTVASTLGVTEARISQLLSDNEFASAVRELRYTSTIKHNARDTKTDEIEDRLLEQLKDAIPMLMRPMEIARTLSMVNGMKRRGSTSNDGIAEKSAIVTITMPKQITQKFTTNINNQVIQAGVQDLITIQSGSMDALISASKALKLAE